MILEDLSGAKVAIIDDVEKEVKSIEEALIDKDIEYEFRKVDLAGRGIKYDVIANVELVFLDLNYNSQGAFNEEVCAELIKNTVPSGKKYYLVAWTRDPDYTESVIEVLKKYNLAPISYTSKTKEKYRIGEDKYDAEKLFHDLEIEFEQIKDTQQFYGEIIDIQEDHVLVNCLLDQGKPFFQVRRFDLSLFENYINISKGNFINVIVTTRPGSRNFEFYNESPKVKELFERPDYFKELGDVSFLDGE